MLSIMESFVAWWLGYNLPPNDLQEALKMQMENRKQHDVIFALPKKTTMHEGRTIYSECTNDAQEKLI